MHFRFPLFGPNVQTLDLFLKLGQSRTTNSKFFYFSGLGGILLALAYGTMVDTEDVILTNITMVTAEEWLTLLLLGGMGLVGFFALTRSLQLIPPTTVAVVRAMEIVLAYGVQAAVLGEVGIIFHFLLNRAFV